MVLQTNASGTFHEDRWYIWHIYLIIAFGRPIFQSLNRKQKLKHYWNQIGTKNSLKIYVQLASCPQQAS
jgi:hypothetical protein